MIENLTIWDFTYLYVADDQCRRLELVIMSDTLNISAFGNHWRWSCWWMRQIKPT